MKAHELTEGMQIIRHGRPFVIAQVYRALAPSVVMVTGYYLDDQREPAEFQLQSDDEVGGRADA